MAHRKKNQDAKQEVSMKEYLDASMELEKLREEQGIQKEEKGISRMISRFFEGRENRVKVPVDKKKYLLLTALMGWWCGAHRFAAKQYFLGILYLAFCWTGIPFAMTIIDLMILIPMEPDEEGKILV